MKPSRIRELLAICEAATPGPWTVDDSHPEYHVSAAYRGEHGGRGHTVSAVEFKTEQGRRDVEFCATARTIAMHRGPQEHWNENDRRIASLRKEADGE